MIEDTRPDRRTLAFAARLAAAGIRVFPCKRFSKAPAISFHLWHTARWADALQGRLGSFVPALTRFAGREQIWDARGLARAWGLGDQLGKEATGMGLDDVVSAAEEARAVPKF